MALNAASIGLRIQQARVAKGMTQGQLAKALGIDRGSVGRWETGRSVPSQVGIPRVAQLLGQSPDWLLEGSGDLRNVDVRPRPKRKVKMKAEPKPKAHQAEADRLVLDDVLRAWDKAKPEARLMAALLVTGDWTYKLKLMNLEIAIGDDVISALGSTKITA